MVWEGLGYRSRSLMFTRCSLAHMATAITEAQRVSWEPDSPREADGNDPKNKYIYSLKLI